MKQKYKLKLWVKYAFLFLIMFVILIQLTSIKNQIKKITIKEEQQITILITEEGVGIYGCK